MGLLNPLSEFNSLLQCHVCWCNSVGSEFLSDTQAVDGSSPSTSTIYATITQLVEQRTHIPHVAGSIPARGTRGGDRPASSA